MVDDGNGQAEVVVVKRGPRLVDVGLILIVGVALGALVSGLVRSDRSEPAIGQVRLVGCGNHVTLVVDAEDLPHGPYELHASLGDGDRVLPLTNSMTFPLIGAQRDYQSLVPDDGRLWIVANVPLAKGQPLQYELVGSDSEVVVGGTFQPNTCL
jgi:hypothetical protein